MLSPYRVVDLSDARGVLAGQMLADLGADVIQVEPPGGSSGRGVAPFFADRPEPSRSTGPPTRAASEASPATSTNPRGRELLLQLLETADFLIESSDVGRDGERWARL